MTTISRVKKNRQIISFEITEIEERRIFKETLEQQVSVLSPQEKKLRNLRWQFLRRSSDYIKDFQKYGHKNYPCPEGTRWWGTPLPFIDPKESAPLEIHAYPIFKLPWMWVNYLTAPLKGKKYFILMPPLNSQVPGFLCSHVHKWEILCPSNCPSFLEIVIEVKPYTRVKDVIKKVEERLKEEIKKMKSAQQSISKDQDNLRRRGKTLDIVIEDLENYLKVYDFIKATPFTWKWVKAVEEIFPEEKNPTLWERNPKGNKKIPNRAGKEKAKNYYQRALRFIQGGWRHI